MAGESFESLNIKSQASAFVPRSDVDPSGLPLRAGQISQAELWAAEDKLNGTLPPGYDFTPLPGEAVVERTVIVGGMFTRFKAVVDTVTIF